MENEIVATVSKLNDADLVPQPAIDVIPNAILSHFNIERENLLPVHFYRQATNSN